jgi:hypothetical protein
MKKFISNLLLFLTSITLSLGVVEILLRINQSTPWKNFNNDKDEPTINQFESKIGWELKEGNFTFKPFTNEGEKFKIKITKGLYRYTGKIIEERNDIAVLGGSIALGFGVNDEDTFSSLLQKKINDYNIKNYGTGGYGTYQSLLKLEKILLKKNKIKYIIAVYTQAHEIRNIGEEAWLRTLSQYSNRGHVYLPFATIDSQEKLKRHEPVKYISLPLRENFAIINKIEKRIMKIIFYSKNRDPIKTTIKIFDEMNRIGKINKSKLIVLNMSGNLDEKYKVFFAKNNIPTIDCDLPSDDNLIIKGDGHPNKKAHTLYSECIFKKLVTLIE